MTVLKFGHFQWQKDVQRMKENKEIKNILKRVHKDLLNKKELAVVSKIEREGVLATDVRYKASESAIRGIPVLFRYSLCSKVADEELSLKCAQIAINNLMRWVRTYRPTGNPINESSFALLFVSADLLKDKLTENEKSEFREWLMEFISKNDAFYETKKEFHTSRVNNHNTWRLVVRSFASTLLNDKVLIEQNRKLIADQIENDLMAPRNWKPNPSCLNQFNESRYGSFDFRQRDALHYHVYTLEAWIWLALMNQDLLSESAKKTILESVGFLKPYFLKEKKHVEFLCSKVPFDKERRDAGIEDFSNETWKPEKARKLLRLARSVFPEIENWTQSVMDENFDPWVKTLAEIQRFQK